MLASLQKASRALLGGWLALSLFWFGLIAVLAIGNSTSIHDSWEAFATLALTPPLALLGAGWVAFEIARNLHQRVFRVVLTISALMLLANVVLTRLGEVLSPEEPWRSIHQLMTASPFTVLLWLAPGLPLAGAAIGHATRGLLQLPPAEGRLGIWRSRMFRLWLVVSALWIAAAGVILGRVLQDTPWWQHLGGFAHVVLGPPSGTLFFGWLVFLAISRTGRPPESM